MILDQLADRTETALSRARSDLGQNDWQPCRSRGEARENQNQQESLGEIEAAS